MIEYLHQAIQQVANLPEVQHLWALALTATQIQCHRILIIGGTGAAITVLGLLAVMVGVWKSGYDTIGADVTIFIGAIAAAGGLIVAIITLCDYVVWVGLSHPEVYLMHQQLFG